MVRRLDRRAVRGRGRLEQRYAQDLPNRRDTDGRHARAILHSVEARGRTDDRKHGDRIPAQQFDVRHRMLKNGKLAVEGFETRVWTVRDAADPERLRSQPIPAEVIARFRDDGANG